MASVLPPTPTYKPNLPREVIEKGLLSDAQLEAVVYAGEAHGKMLPAAEGETARRKGHMLGDGTGVGKGREISGIFLDNWNQGRTKGVWVSEKQTLIEDAKRDWSGIGQNPNLIFNIGKVKTGEPMSAQKGIGFVTYDTLKGGMSDQAALTRGGFVRKQPVSVNGQGGIVSQVGKATGGKPVQITVKLDNGTSVTVPSNEVKALKKASIKSRIDQIVEWVGKDFDGVIAFDEAHNMGNATTSAGERGKKDAAMKAIAGMELQKRLPNARVLYVSATGATEISNLAYAERLGLWGRGTPFASRDAFVSELEQGGIATMELIARDMKQLGLYTARNLSYDGVEYQRLEHKLDANQREIYDALAEAWQVVLRNINAALKATGADKGLRRHEPKARRRCRHFGAVISASSTRSSRRCRCRPSSRRSRRILPPAGKRCCNSPTPTRPRRSALRPRRNPPRRSKTSTSPRATRYHPACRKFVPDAAIREIRRRRRQGERSRPVVDSQGRPVENKEAVAAREHLIDKLASVRVPQGPLDMILDHFGVDTVAEVTGRGRRFVHRAR